MKRTEKLDRLLEEKNFDAFLMRENSDNANMYYLTGFKAADPFIFLRKDGESTMIVSQLEYSRAKEEAAVDQVLKSSEFTAEDSGNRTERLVEKITERFDIQRLAVPEDFPLKTADNLRDKIDLEPVEDRVEEARKIKDGDEVKKLKKVQSVTEAAMKQVEKMIENSRVVDNELYLEDQPLTSERMKQEIRSFLVKNDCSTPEDMIVACGNDSAKPHSTGSGKINSGKPIVVDIFPRHGNRYFGDMTRTFVKGEADEKVKEMKKAVLEAQRAAFKVLEQGAGVKASEVHDAVCDVLEERGYATLRQGETDSGFIHSTGHAVGLELHENPGIAENDDELEAGNVLTIEPGLYLPEVGGVRIEDMILIKKEGFENFNSMHREMEI